MHPNASGSAPGENRARPLSHRLIHCKSFGNRIRLVCDSVGKCRIASILHHSGNLVKRNQPVQKSLDRDFIRGG
jgi:hypothetical protein